MAPLQLPIHGVRVKRDDLHGWTREVVRRVGTPPDIAVDVADVLVAADLRGIASHGTWRLPVYVSLAEAGVLDASARPAVVGGTHVVRVYDARDGWGPHAGRVLMDDAIARAGELGLAGSLARRASHFGIAGWYALRAAARGLVGIVLTNTTPLAAPTRGRTRMLGTNPLAVAAPAGRREPFLLDMATTALTWGHVLLASERAEALPPGVAIDAEGEPTTDPARVLAGGSLLGLGGSEETGGYKGYGLALMVDILTGVLAGAAFGSRVVPFSTTLGPSDLGQLFLAIDPARLGNDAFEARLERLLDELGEAPAAPDARGPVLIPGEPEARAEDEQLREGIRLREDAHDALVRLGSRLGVEFPATVPFGEAVPA
jgi:LDH2 family malate/lactate/ureidoglycolate dehydrogenase